MSYIQSGEQKKLYYSVQKNKENNEKIKILNIESVNDNSEFIWKSSSHILDYYWSVYYEKYGTNLQDLFSTDNESQLPYQDYLDCCIKQIVSNKFDGLVKVDKFEENEVSWDISTSAPPSTLLNCLRYTPWRIANKEVLSSFIIYQIASAVEELHSAGIPHLGLSLDNIFIDENFVVKIGLPSLDVLSDKVRAISDNREKATESTLDNSQNLNAIIWKWMCGEMSNLDYLLYLNELAGRSESDPNNHPMIPWVTDFSSINGGFRDLKISKFRINKGDEHLDKIYQDQDDALQQFDKACPLGINMLSDVYKKFSNLNKPRISKQFPTCIENDGIIVETLPYNPHHVSDILSELTYYAYMARVTSIDVLKKCVRSFYNPEEFRWDMAKMYSWSPDECIPQFFTDPSVFRSTHADMPDIGLPQWCKDPEEFVKYHRGILESEQISVELNHWIDLVFGYKLLGDASVEAKNVHRQFTEKSPYLTNNGLTVLFRKPHPKRLCYNKNIMKYFGPKRPKDFQLLVSTMELNTNFICLPDDYDPCELIEYYKNYSVFIQNSCTSSAVEIKSARILPKCALKSGFEEDVVDLCCLIIELFNADKLRSDYLLSKSDKILRVSSCALLFNEEPSRIPLAFRDTVEKVVNGTTKGIYIPSIFELKRSQRWLIFDKCVMKIFDLMSNIRSMQMDTVVSLKYFFLSQNDVPKFNNDILAIITPHLISLLNLDLLVYFDQVLDILVCILHRFGLIAGRNILIRDILPHVIKLYPKSRNLVMNKHALLYQRNFLNLLLIRIGMGAFLNNMVGLLVNMLVIGQHVFGSMKESTTPEMELKQSENDSESLNGEERNTIWNFHLDDDIQDFKKFQMDGVDMDSESIDTTFSPPESDSISQCGIDIDEQKNPLIHSNGYIQNSLPNLLDLLPSSNPDTVESSSSSNKLKLLISPFKKRQNSKNQVKKIVISKVEKRKNLSQDCSKMSLAQLSHSSLIWLADLIGPIEASSKILCELLAQFSFCYQNCSFDSVPPELWDECDCSLVTGTYDSFIQADRDVSTVLECLRDFIGLYGLAVVWHQIRHFLDTLLDKTIFIGDDMLVDTETSLVCSLSLLRFLSMLIPNIHLEMFLSDKVLDEYLPLIISTIGNMSKPFPSGKRSRQVLLHKVIDLIYLLSSRLNVDEIKDNMNNIYNLLFGLFSKTFNCNNEGEVIYRDVPTDVIETTKKERETSLFYVNFLAGNNDFTILPTKANVPTDDLTKDTKDNTYNQAYRTISVTQRETAFEEMKYVITTELAYVLYISFAKLMGQNKLDSLICNQPLIQALMAHHELYKTHSSYSTPDKVKQHKLEESLNLLTNSVMVHKRRHLTGLWKEYWSYELGFCDSMPFDIKQMCLGKFEGHSSTVKGFDTLNCENGFLSYAKDKVVKLYSIADIDYGNLETEVSSRFTYVHSKPVSEAIFIEQMRMAVSLDGSVHLWDPFIGKRIFNNSLGASNPNWNVVCSILPSQSQIGVANSDGRIHVVDLRSGSTSYSYHLNTSNTFSPVSNDFPSNTGGVIKKMAATPDGNHLIIGNSDGFLNMIDLRMTKLISTWRPHQQEITQINFMKNWCLTSSMEPNGRVSLTNLSNFSQSHMLHGQDLGAIHSLMVLRDQVVVSASQNKFGLFQSVGQYKSLIKLSPAVYKGTVSTASLLLHNRLLLLGNDFGNISLWY